MIRINLDYADIDAVRGAVLAYEQQHGLTHADVAARAKISYHAVALFLEGRRDSVRTIAYLLAYLPLGLSFTPPAIIRHRDEAKSAM
jgi:transcriptional regulator with XRE-family HTH domain